MGAPHPAVAHRDEDFGVLANSRFWPMLARDLRREVWTDSYCNILGSASRSR